MAKLIQQVRKNSSGETPRYRVWNAINPPGNKDWCGLYTHCSRMDYYSVENPEEAYRLIKELIQEQLQDSEIFANAFGLEELEEGEYFEWYSYIDGEDIRNTEEYS